MRHTRSVWCLENAERWHNEWQPDEHLAADIEIATLIAALTSTQRKKLAAINTYREES